MASIELNIVTPHEHKTLEVEWVEVISPTGTFYVGPGHAAIVSLIKHKAPIAYQQAGCNQDSFEADHGIFYFADNKALVLSS